MDATIKDPAENGPPRLKPELERRLKALEDRIAALEAAGRRMPGRPTKDGKPFRMRNDVEDEIKRAAGVAALAMAARRC